MGTRQKGTIARSSPKPTAGPAGDGAKGRVPSESRGARSSGPGPANPAPLVLVADDDMQQRLLMVESLKGANIDVVEAADGQETLDLFAQARPDLILLDVMMPRLDGFEVCTRLRARPDGRHVPILIVTGLEDVESIDQAFQAGATDFITKPIKWSLLSNRVRYALRTSQTEKDLRITRDALQGSERHFRALTENSLDLISILDGDGRLMFISHSIESLSGYAPKEVAGELFFDFIHPDDLDDFMNFFRCLTEQPDAVDSMEFRFRHKDASWHDVEAKGKNLLDDASVQGVFLTSRDITKRKEAERHLIDAKIEAERADKAKSLFLANMSHELRTPLNPIMGFATMLMAEDEVSDPKVRQYAADIHASGQHLLGVIDNILEQTRVDTGKVVAQKEQVDLDEICSAALRLAGCQNPDLGLTVDVEVQPDMPALFADPRLLTQILINLISNGIKFTPSGGTIRVSARHDDKGAEHIISVQDNGIGMPRNELAEVLRPFYQVDQTFSRSYGGTGLGLSLVNSFVELHGGKFTLDSELGEGTTATCRFPRYQEAAPGSLDEIPERKEALG